MDRKKISNLNWPYVFVLIFLGALALVSYKLINASIDNQQSDAVEINMAGRQRALSQKIALLSNYITSHSTGSELLSNIKLLELNIDLIQSSHQSLSLGNSTLGISPPNSERLKAYYFGTEVKLDQKIKSYITKAEQNLELFKNNDIKNIHIFSIEEGSNLFSILDSVTNQYQFESEQNTAKFKDIQFLTFLLTVLVLLLSGLFVFKPMVIKIQSYILSIQEAEKRYRSISNSSSIAMIVISAIDNKIVSWNPAAELMFEYTEAEIQNQSLTIIIPDRYEDKHNEAFKRVFTGDNYTTIGKTLELHGLKKTGKEFPLELSLGTWTQSGEKYFSLIIRDITERNITQAALRRSQKMDAIGELSGGLSHDFNNLLGIIIGNLDLINMQIKNGSKVSLHIEKARNAAMRGATLTKRLLNFSRQSPSAHSPINLNKVLENIDVLVSKALTSNVVMEHEFSESIWLVDIDPSDFEDAIINLSLNARDAMPDGGRLIIETNNVILDNKMVALKGDITAGDFVEVVITDTGDGIPKNITDKIFDPFFTTKETSKGTGIGLAMVYGFVQRSEGHISVYSEEYIGTTFRIYLPRSLSEQPIKDVQKINLTEPFPTGNETILVVDDEEDLVEIAADILEDIGYTIVPASSGDEAYKILEERTDIDLVFSDVVMPGMSGFDLANMAVKLRPETKVLLTSGYTGRLTQTNQTKRWSKNLIAKPYRSIKIAKKIRETLDEKQ